MKNGQHLAHSAFIGDAIYLIYDIIYKYLMFGLKGQTYILHVTHILFKVLFLLIEIDEGEKKLLSF